MTLSITVSEGGLRVDTFLAQTVEGLSRSAAAKLLEEEQVLCNGKPLKKRDTLQAGDVLTVSRPDPEPSSALPENIPLDVVFEDDDVIVINKPVGMVVHPAPGHPTGTLVNALLYHCGDSLSGVGGALRPGIVHRIDRDTSGLLIVAKNDTAHAALSAQLQDHSLYREYETVIIGGFREEAGTIDAPIGRHRTDRKRMAIDPQHGRSAVTHWQVIARYGGYTHLRCRLETGRTHQIRVHLASVGHPVLGDLVYGGKKPYPGLVGQCLHAKCLSFQHPRTGEMLRLECPLPPYFTNLLAKFNRQQP